MSSEKKSQFPYGLANNHLVIRDNLLKEYVSSKSFQFYFKTPSYTRLWSGQIEKKSKPSLAFLLKTSMTLFNYQEKTDINISQVGFGLFETLST